MAMTTPRPMTEPQIVFIRALQRKLSVPDTLLDNECVKRFGRPVSGLDVRQASELIDLLYEWKERPAELERAKGQLDLFDFGPGA